METIGVTHHEKKLISTIWIKGRLGDRVSAYTISLPNIP